MSQRGDLGEGGPRAGIRASPPEKVEKAEVLPRQALEERNASGQGHSTVNFPVRNAGGRSARLLILYGVSVVNI